MRTRARLCGATVAAALWLGLPWSPCLYQPARCHAGAEDPGATLLFNTASRLYRQQNWGEAAAVFADFLRKHPRHKDAPEARFARGLCLHRLGRDSAAAGELRRAARVKKAPWLPDARFYLGRTLEALARKEEKRAARAQGLRDAAKQYGLAAAARREARGRLPKESAERRRELFAGYVQALASKGEALYRAGDHSGALRTLAAVLGEDGVKSLDTYPRALYILALAHDALAGAKRSAADPRSDERRSHDHDGRRDDERRGDDHRVAAISALRELSAARFASHVLWEEAVYLLGRWLQAGGDYAGSVKEYDRLIERGGDRVTEARYHRALALFYMGGDKSWRAATGAFVKFHADHPRHKLAARAFFYAALGDFNRRDYTSAAARLEAFLKDAGAKKAPADLLAQASLSLGQSLLLCDAPNAPRAVKLLERAVEAARAAASKAGGDARPATVRLAQAVFWHGQALLRAGAAAEAIPRFEKVSAEYRSVAPELAEEAQYRKALSYFHASKHEECAAALYEYRRRYSEGRAGFYVEALELAGRNALQAPRGRLEEKERRRAPKYFESAAAMAERPAEAVRLRYLAGTAHYSNSAFREAAHVLESVYKELPKAQRSGGEYPDLAFLLADSLAQLPRPEPLDAAGRRRVKRANKLYREYLESAKGAAAKSLRYGDTALARIGYTHEWLGESERARRALARFLKSFPKHPDAAGVRFHLAHLQSAAGDTTAAVREFRMAARHTQSWDIAVSSLVQAGRLLSRSGQPVESSKLLLKALKRIPPDQRKNPKARQYEETIRYRHAMNLVATERTKDAKEALAQFVQAFPRGARASDARVELAYIQLDENDPKAALRTTAPLVAAGAEASSSKRDEALYLRAWSFARLAEAHEGKQAKDPQAAAELRRLHARLIASYTELIEKHPDSSFLNDAILELAQHHFNHQAPAEATKWFLRLKERLTRAGGSAPDLEKRERVLLEECLFGLAYLAFEEKDYVTARALFDEVAERRESPLAPQSLFQAARAWMLAKRDAEAIKRFKILTGELAPRAGGFREETYLRMGECHHRLKEYPQAIAVLKQQLKEFPEGRLRHQGRFVLGFAQQFSDRFQKAIENFRQVVRASGDVVAARAQYHIGECYMDQGKFRQAAREFVTVVANFDRDAAGYRSWVRRALLAAGNAYSAAGDSKAAVKEWRELARRFPDTAEAKAAAGKLQQSGEDSETSTDAE